MEGVLSESAARALESLLEAETQISYAKPDVYNDCTADGDDVSAVSASGRVMLGAEEVRAATVVVSKGNVGERNRFVDYLACGAADGMCYAVIKSGVEIDKEDGQADSLCWIITYVLKGYLSAN